MRMLKKKQQKIGSKSQTSNVIVTFYTSCAEVGKITIICAKKSAIQTLSNGC